MDIGGPEAVRIWTERAGLTFPTLLDPENRLGAVFGFKAIPNGILLNPAGTIRYTKFGGFDVANAADLSAVEAAIASTPSMTASNREAVQIDQRAAQAALLLRDGAAQIEAGNRAAGLLALREALRLDPANFVIRKQLWRADHPERFGEVIDSDWQQTQLARERAALTD